MVLFVPVFAAPLDLPSGNGSSAVSLTTYGNHVEMVWIEPQDGAPQVLHAIHDGSAWSRPTVVAQNEALFVNWADTPVLGHAGDGSSIVAYPRKSGEGTYAYDVVVSRWSGTKWTELGSPHRDGTQTEHGFPSLVADGQGFRVFWLDGRLTADSGPMTLRTARWNGGFEPSRVLDDRVCDCCGTDAMANGDGWRVVYRDRSETELRDIAFVDGDGSTGRVADDGWQIPGCPVNGPRVIELPAGRVVAWTTGTAGLEVRASFRGRVGVVASADTEPAGRVDLVAAGTEAVVTWLGSDGIYARRLAAGPGGLRGGDPVKIAATGSSRSTGFPRAAVLGDNLWTIWTEKSGLVGERTPLSTLPNVSDSLPPPGATHLSPATWRPADLKVKTLAGEAGELRLEGELTLVTTWASWCGPCRSELDALRTIARTHPQLDLQVIAVDDTVTAIRKAADEPPGTWWLAQRADVRGSLGSDSVPSSWLVSRDGTSAWHHPGALTPDGLAAALADVATR